MTTQERIDQIKDAVELIIRAKVKVLGALTQVTPTNETILSHRQSYSDYGFDQLLGDKEYGLSKQRPSLLDVIKELKEDLHWSQETKSECYECGVELTGNENTQVYCSSCAVEPTI
tara:strand:- start:293 stop:640 length:348 start_codon:yes stop_codon:yes gene_type:complete